MTTETDLWRDGEVLWRPSDERIAASRVTEFRSFVAATRNLDLPDYEALWRWSVDDLPGFWAAVWDYLAIESPTPYRSVVEGTMPAVRWFDGAQLNFAARALARADDTTALVAVREDGFERTLTYRELRDRVAAVSAGLRRMGVARGDKVVGLLPNSLEAAVAFLATAAIGAIWSACSPEYGVQSIQDRFGQLEPDVLITVDGYLWNGTWFPIDEKIAEVRASLPTLRSVAVVPVLEAAVARDDVISWSSLAAEPAPLEIEPLPFDHPLWILYSSGTTGKPKAIVHGHGGIVLGASVNVMIQMDLRPDDCLFWYTTTSWVLWNILMAGLMAGSTVVLYEGSPLHPGPDAIWALAERHRVTYFGHSSNWYQLCMTQGLEPGRDHDLSSLRTLGATGSPLLPETNRWLYDRVGRDLHVASASGGTELCGPIVGGSSVLPVRAGEMQYAALGVDAEAWDVDGRPVVGEVGELVIKQPMPTMPLRLWGDDGRRLHESYFDVYPGVWRHGDWVLMTRHGGAIIYGRSDATLNRGGVRTGTSEFYRIVEQLPEIADSLVIDTSYGDRPGELILFVQLAEGWLHRSLVDRISGELRSGLSPRHVPDRIIEVSSIPYTLTGKKCEVPVKRLLLGAPVDQVASIGVLSDPEALDVYAQIAAQLAGPGAA